MKPSLFVLLLAWAVPTSLLAWNKEGHMLTAAVAYLTLKKDNPQAVARVVALLEKQPAFQKKIVGYQSAKRPGKTWAEFTAGLSGDDREMALFMLAARWADDAKSYTNERRPLYYKVSGDLEGNKAWHYINYRYTPNDNKLSALPVPGPNILDALKLQEAKVKTGKDSNRAKALCWMMHLLGDIHQPLHAVALFVDTLPEGDQGGNLLWVKRPKQGRKKKDQLFKLHAFWDDNYFDQGRMDGLFNAVKKQATAMVANPALAKGKFPKLNTNKTPDKWVKKETAPLAKQFAYANGTLPIDTNRTRAVLLPAAYVQNATRVQGPQIMLVGYRMAKWLRGFSVQMPLDPFS